MKRPEDDQPPGPARPDPGHPSSEADTHHITPPDRLFVELLDRLLPTAGPEAAAAPIERLTSLGRFRVLRELGRGGFGVVYLAEDLYLPRPVALKVPEAPLLLDAAQRERFLREAKAAALLDHPNIVAVHEAGQVGGVLYIAYAYCAGPTLAQWLRRRGLRVPAHDAARLMAVLADAVHAAHQRAILHRDLKPSNVLLQRSEVRGQKSEDADATLSAILCPLSSLSPKVSDFGLAKLLDEGTGQTATGLVLGTPSYMAPEQARGRSQDAGAAVDVYGLGAILYELLAGRPPFRGASDIDTLRQVVADDPPPPRRERIDVPADLEAVCLKCLEKEPRHRYPSAAALADDLRRFLDGRPTAARPIGPLGRVTRWARRRPDLAGLTALTATAVFAALAIGVGLSIRLAVSRADTRAAERIAATQEFYALFEHARQRRFEPRPGWIRDSLADLRRAAQLSPAAARLPELRSETAACLAGTDVLPARSLSGDFPVYAVAYSPDGRRLALGGWGPEGDISRVRLVDADDGRVVRELTFAINAAKTDRTGKLDGCRRLAFSPDGRWLVATSRHGGLHRWDLTTDAVQAVSWQTQEAEQADVAFGVVRPLLFSASGKVLQCWDPADGWQEVGRWEVTYFLGRSAVDPLSGRVSVHIDSELHLLDGRTLQPCRPPVALYGSNAAFSPGGRTIAVANSNSLTLAEADSGSVLRSLTGPDGEKADTAEITELAFSPDGALLATASEWSRHVKLWDVARGRLVADLMAGRGGSMRLAFRPDSRSLVVASDRQAVVYDVTGTDVRSAAALQPYPVTAADVSPDGSLLACLADVGPKWTVEVSCWPVGPEAPNRPRVRLEKTSPVEHNRFVVALRPGGGMVYTAGDALEYCSDAADGRPERLPIRELKEAHFGPDGRLWVAAGHEVHAYELPGWRRAALWANGPEDRQAARVFYTVAPGSDGVLVGRRDGQVFRLDAAGNLRATWPVGAAPVTALALYERADLAVAGDEAGRVRVFRVSSGEVVADLPAAHRDAVDAAALSPDGRLVATGGHDRAVRLWRPDGTAVLTLPAMGPVTMLTFGPGGEELFVLVTGERGVRRWHLGRLAERLRELGIDPGY